MPKRRKNGPPVIATETLSRRTVVEWLGKSTVLALGGGLAAACAPRGYAGAADGSAPPVDPIDTGFTDLACDAGDFPFAAGSDDHAIFEGWGERTVDPQDLVSLLESWTLRVDGMVASPVELSFADLLSLPRQDQVTDFHCVEGWSVYDVPWNGVHMTTLLDLVSPNEAASHITFHCSGGTYLESLPIPVALEERSLLAYGIDCATLPLRSGFPLRVVVPRKHAYKSARYVTRLELTDEPIQGFWEQYGYPYEADVPESRLREGKY